MRSNFTVLAASVICAVLIGLTSASPLEAKGRGGDGSACIGNVEAWLQEGGVDLDTVESIEVTANVRRNNDGDSRFLNWQAWVRFKGSEGTINFSMRRDCQLMHSWSSDDVEWNGPGSEC